MQNEERETRVIDYIDDKLQTEADFESLDALLLSVRNQQALLRKQLQDAEKDLGEARQAAAEHDRTRDQQKARFQKDQVDIDRRLRIVTVSDTSDDAVAKFEASMDRLKRLDVADGYVKLLQQADEASKACTAALGKDDNAALTAYQQLRSLSLQLLSLQRAADDAAPHLVHHIESRANDLQREIELAFTKEFQAVLEKIGWPTTDVNISDALFDEFSETFLKLLNLQLPDLLNTQSKGQGRNAEVLLPLKVMAHAFELGFRYHFEGDKPTNRLDRPEYFLSHITDRLLSKYSDFYAESVQTLLVQKFNGTALENVSLYMDASSAFITSLLPMVRAKVFSILPQCVQQPQLLSHLIHELMDFDTKLRDDWQYDVDLQGGRWRGITWDILTTGNWFATWLGIEKDFALARYEEIVAAPDSFTIDFDSVTSTQTKPTKAAIRVNDLIETTTDHYRTLGSFSQKIRFLIDIQTSLFDRFHGRLADNLRSYIARTSTLTRTSKEEQIQLQGIAGLETLCKTYGSAEYLELSMRDWSDDVFFLDLWSELQARAAAAQSGQPMLAGEMTLSQVAEKTSASINASSSEANTQSDDKESLGSIFDEPASSYSRLRSRCETLMVELLQNNIKQSLNGYARINPWATLAIPTTDSLTSTSQPITQLPTSAELDPLLSSLSTLLAFLHKALSQLALQRIVRQACQTLDSYLLDRILLVHTFSSSGIAQFTVDLKAVQNVLRRYAGESVSVSGVAKSVEAVGLIGLPIMAGGGDDESSSVAENLEDGGGVGGGGSGPDGKRKWSLWDAERRLIKSSNNDEARVFLVEELGVERLSLVEARKALARRVELGS